MTRSEPLLAGRQALLVEAWLAAADGPAIRAARQPVEQRLARWFRDHPRLGRRDRTRIADALYHLLRHRRLYEALARHRGLADPEGPAALVAAAGAVGAGVGDSLAEPGRTGPAGLIEAIEAEAGSLAPAVRLSLPDWLWDRLAAQYGLDRAEAIGLALLEPASTDIRVNLIRARVPEVRDALARAGLVAGTIEGLPQGLRLAGRAPLETLAAFRDGAFERQDAGSQRIVAFAAPRRGQTVIDFCAGAGGKTLALASAMRNSGRILAFDPSDARLERLRERCARAGANRVTTYRIDDEHDPGLARFAGRGDLVLVDAPCSGTGTLRRDPGLKWLLRPQDIADHAARQRSILAAAAALVAPGGRLVYATCSLLEEENEAVMAAFDLSAGASRLQWSGMAPSEAAHGHFEPVSARPVGQVTVLRHAEPSDASVGPIIGSGVYSGADEAKWTPDRDKSDGFYAARRTALVPAHYNPA